MNDPEWLTDDDAGAAGVTRAAVDPDDCPVKAGHATMPDECAICGEQPSGRQDRSTPLDPVHAGAQANGFARVADGRLEPRLAAAIERGDEPEIARLTELAERIGKPSVPSDVLFELKGRRALAEAQARFAKTSAERGTP